MSPGEFEDRLKRVNKDFRVKKGGEFDYSDPLFPKFIRRFEVWCKDGHGVSYLIRTYTDHVFDLRDLDWFVTGERIRKRAEQVAMVKKLAAEREAQKDAVEKEQKDERIAIAKENFSGAKKFCDEHGIIKHKPTIYDEGWNNRFFSAGIPGA